MITEMMREINGVINKYGWGVHRVQWVEDPNEVEPPLGVEAGTAPEPHQEPLEPSSSAGSSSLEEGTRTPQESRAAPESPEKTALKRRMQRLAEKMAQR